MLYIFLLFLLILLMIAYHIFDDICSPSVLMIGGYVVATFCATLNVKKWNTNVSGRALLIITFGIMCVLFSEVIIFKLAKNKSNIENSKVAEKLEIYTRQIEWWKLVIIILICIIATIFSYREISRMGSNNSGLVSIAYIYKTRNAESELSFFSKLLMKITKAFAFSCSFIFLYFILKNKKVWRNLALLIPAFFYIIQSILVGSRIRVIMYFVGIVFYFSILSFYINGTRWRINIFKTVKIIIFAFLFMYLFYTVKELFGRSQEYNFVDYILTYLGGSIDLLGQYIRNPQGYNKMVETLPGIIDNLQRYLGLFNTFVIHSSFEHRKAVNGILIGNTYTGFRNYYNDFGILGVAFFSSMLSIIFSKKIYKIRNYKTISIKQLCEIIFWGSLLYCIPFHFFADYFYYQLALSFVVEIIIFGICTWFLFVKIKLGKDK